MLTPGTTTPCLPDHGPDGHGHRFDVEHEKKLHLIVVRRDTAGFQHVHRRWRRTAPGPFRSTPAHRAATGLRRLQATGSEAVTLGVDLSAPGDFQPATYTESEVFRSTATRSASNGHLDAGSTAELTLTVTKDGQPVTDLEPYLGAYGTWWRCAAATSPTCTSIRRARPATASPAGPDVTFSPRYPRPGTYRLFLDFQHEGVSARRSSP